MWEQLKATTALYIIKLHRQTDRHGGPEFYATSKHFSPLRPGPIQRAGHSQNTATVLCVRQHKTDNKIITVSMLISVPQTPSKSVGAWSGIFVSDITYALCIDSLQHISMLLASLNFIPWNKCNKREQRVTVGVTALFHCKLRNKHTITETSGTVQQQPDGHVTGNIIIFL